MADLEGRTYKAGGRSFKEPPQDLTRDYHQGKRLSNTNKFTGAIPSPIGNLSNLKRLEIANQQNIQGGIPPEIGNLTNLEGLYMSMNDFSGTSLPSSLGKLKNLKHLYIAGAQLQGNIPSSFENLTNLMFLNLGETGDYSFDNQLTGTIPDFSRLTELRSLSLSANNLSGAYPTYFNNGNFSRLITLRLSWNELTGKLQRFDKLPRLRSFGADGNNLTGGIDVTGLSSEIILWTVGWNNLSGTIDRAGWPDFNQLRRIRLNNNNFTGDIPCTFWEKIENPALSLASVSNNNFRSNCTSAMSSVKGNGNLNIEVVGNNF